MLGRCVGNLAGLKGSDFAFQLVDFLSKVGDKLCFKLSNGVRLGGHYNGDLLVLFKVEKREVGFAKLKEMLVGLLCFFKADVFYGPHQASGVSTANELQRSSSAFLAVKKAFTLLKPIPA